MINSKDNYENFTFSARIVTQQYTGKIVARVYAFLNGKKFVNTNILYSELKELFASISFYDEIKIKSTQDGIGVYSVAEFELSDFIKMFPSAMNEFGVHVNNIGEMCIYPPVNFINIIPIKVSKDEFLEV